MGPLAAGFQRIFSPRVRERGHHYFSKGAVRIIQVAETLAHARVLGSRLYSVSLEMTPEETLNAQCDCPYASGSGDCKHVWATLLAAESRGFGREFVVSKFGNHPELGIVSLADRNGYSYDDTDADDRDHRQIEVDEPWDDEDADNDFAPPHAPAYPRLPNQPGHRPGRPDPIPWQRLLDSLHGSLQSSRESISRQSRQALDSQLLYVIDVPRTINSQGLCIELMSRRTKKTGGWTIPKKQSISPGDASALKDPADAQIVSWLHGADSSTYGSYYRSPPQRASTFLVPEKLRDMLLPTMAATGRLLLRTDYDGAGTPLTVEEGPPWELCLEVQSDSKARQYVLRGSLLRGEQREEMTGPSLLLSGGWVFWPDRMARLDDFGAFYWIGLLRDQKEIRVPTRHGMELVEKLHKFPHLPRISLPQDLQFEQVQGTARPRLVIRRGKSYEDPALLVADLSFDYENSPVAETQHGRGILEPKTRRMILRDTEAERQAAGRLDEMGVSVRSSYEPERRLRAQQLPRVVSTLVNEGWQVQAEGKLYRRASNFNLSVSSGIDWFEMRGQVTYGDKTIELPALLAALRKGENLVSLGGGNMGILPEEWLKRYSLVAKMGEAQGDCVRFEKTQAGLLDALLAEQPEVTFDAGFAQVRQELDRFNRVEAADAPDSFTGTLRGYQRDGLGWLNFLRQFGFGGCLADDMGLGKTIQVLAMLESRRRLRAEATNGDSPGPSLVVVPRSLIFNWQQEAQRFTPGLKVLDHTGIGRAKDGNGHFKNYDLVLTTYGTLRRDIAHLKDVAFDYVILDEAQAIKNADTSSAKAARLLRASHRLCLSGTPVENHLGELWSQLEFLNPGMLGASSVLASTANGDTDAASRQMLARALRPFILRRTKAQVAPELPEKTEQTVYCELAGEQRAMYDQLRAHYRQALLGHIDQVGIGKSKIQILEALLRLRQAACHPGLIDKTRVGEPCAKLETLLPQLTEVVQEGHKALVFSQFTSMLAILRSRLDEQGIVYEYLDGRTRDRQERVARFQEDDGCKLFLISLKAGGLGLNLTAAEYVFLLDPWWNPAVEAQAIDRAHRIGQTQRVFAYRLIARDTVEERVLDLQKAKRELADAIINADNSLIRTLQREDLELLLG